MGLLFCANIINAQKTNSPIKLDIKQGTNLDVALGELVRTTGMNLLFNPNDMHTIRLDKMHISERSIEKALTKLIAGTKIIYKKNGTSSYALYLSDAPQLITRTSKKNKPNLPPLKDENLNYKIFGDVRDSVGAALESAMYVVK